MKKSLLIAIAAATFKLSAQGPTICLNPPPGSPFSTGAFTNPRGLLSADFNGDGKPDLATVNPGGNNVSILTGIGNGNFNAPSTFSVSPGPWNMACGDLNNDSKPDLVTCNNGFDLVSVILNTGAGNFGSSNTFTTGSQPMGIAIGDLNNDGNKDIVTANSGGNSISLLIGAGNGTFGSATDFPTTGFSSQAVAIADVNGDGKMDVITANRMSNNISILMGNGAGSFTATTTYSANALFPCSIAVEDFNGDGSLDIATANNDFNLPKSASIFINNGSGSFFTGILYSGATANGNFLSIASGDINGDSYPDIALINSGELSILAGTGFGAFGTPVTYSLGSGNGGIIMKDLNMDGRPDIGISEQNDDVNVLLNHTAIITASGLTTFCSGEKVTLHATQGGSAYSWAPTSGSADSLVVTASGSYSVTITSGLCSSISNAINISVNPLPTVSIAGSSSVICSGQSATLTASGAASYSWQPMMSSLTSVVISPSITATYTAIGTSAAGCTNTAVKTLTVNPLPSINASTSNSLLCVGQSATLTASGSAISYNWNPGGAGSSIVISPTVNTTYSITGVDANGCSNTTTLTQNVTCTGIIEKNKETFVSIYPNPNNGSATIKADKEEALIVSDELGRVLETIELNETNGFTYKIDNLKTGIYFISDVKGGKALKMVCLE